MHSGYIDLILVTSGLSRRRCPLHFLQGGDITADLPHNHHHPPLCSLGNPLIPTVISFVVARLSLARTASHHSSFVLWGFGKRGGDGEAYWTQECATCYQDTCREKGWTLLRVLIGLIFLASSMQRSKERVWKGTFLFQILIVLQEKFNWHKEFRVKPNRLSDKTITQCSDKC